MRIKKFKELNELKDPKSFDRAKQYIELYKELNLDIEKLFDEWSKDDSWSYAPELYYMIDSIIQICEGKLDEDKYEYYMKKLDEINDES